MVSAAPSIPPKNRGSSFGTPPHRLVARGLTQVGVGRWQAFNLKSPSSKFGGCSLSGHGLTLVVWLRFLLVETSPFPFSQAFSCPF